MSTEAERSPAVLFISHYNERTGAPLVLLCLLQWLRRHTRLRSAVLVRGGGSLVPEFAAVADIVPYPRLSRPAAAALRRWSGESAVRRWEDRRLRRRVARLAPALIYSNTITNLRAVEAVAGLGIPVLCHVHEMEYWIRHELGLEAVRRALPRIDRFVAVGRPIRDYLAGPLGVAADRIDVTDTFPFPGALLAAPGDRGAMRREWKADDGTFVVGGCGTADWRKGADLFVAVARALALRHPGCSSRFVWAGAAAGPFRNQLEHDLVRADVGEMVSFPGPCSRLPAFYAGLDAFVVTSREDCGPMVMLEAAAAGVPVVCFERSGGAPEFVRGGAGLAVPYLDTAGMADALARLAGDSGLRRSCAEAAARKLQTHHNREQRLVDLFQAMARTQPQIANAAIISSARS